MLQRVDMEGRRSELERGIPRVRVQIWLSVECQMPVGLGKTRTYVRERMHLLGGGKNGLIRPGRTPRRNASSAALVQKDKKGKAV